MVRIFGKSSNQSLFLDGALCPLFLCVKKFTLKVIKVATRLEGQLPVHGIPVEVGLILLVPG